MDSVSLKTQRLQEAYNSYADTLFRIALTHTCNREDAEDACQDVFIKYANSGVSFDSKEHEKAWFIRVLINHCRDLIRKHKTRTHLSLDEISDVISDTDNSSEYLDLIAIIEKLPLKYREVVILHYLEGYSVEETSTLLKSSASAVKMRLMRARDMIKDKYKEEE